MNTATVSIEQQARITQISGNVQLIRDGFFLPAQVGMTLLPGDRVVSDTAAKAIIQFTGVNDALVIEKGAAATFNLEVVEMDQPPQWIATELYGEGVYFDSKAAVQTKSSEDTVDLFGLFGTTHSDGESTAYPVLESIAALAVTAAIYSDNENNDNNTETINTAGSESGNNTDSGTGTANPPPAENDQEPEPDPEAGPADLVLAPVTELVDGTLTSLWGATSSPLGSQPLPMQGGIALDPPNSGNLS